MPTQAQLQNEKYWGREIVTPEVHWLGDSLCTFYNRPADAFGSKGNFVHLSGAHRSQEWILNSRWSKSRTYTVQAGLTADQSRLIAGIDYTPGAVEAMIAQSKRLLAEMQAGRLEELLELYCNVGGDKIVDGWDNIRDRAATADDSHLWHWHGWIDRRLLRHMPTMRKIFAVVTGQQGDDDSMLCSLDETGAKVEALQRVLNAIGRAVKADGEYGPQTAAAVAAEAGFGDGHYFGPSEYAVIMAKLGATGRKGDPGDPGPRGAPGKTPTKVRLAGVDLDVIAAE